MNKTYFPNDLLKETMLIIIINSLKRDYDSWVYVGGSVEKFKKEILNEARIITIERATGENFEDVLNGNS